MSGLSIVELVAIVGTCLIAVATFVFLKDKSLRDEVSELKRWTHDEMMALSNACVKREELHNILTSMRHDITEIRSWLASRIDKATG